MQTLFCAFPGGPAVKSSAFAVVPPRLDKSMLDEVARANPAGSLVEQVFILLAGRMHASGLGAGAKLPSVRALAGACEVSADTVARAYERLVAHGLVEARRGSGYFVRSAGRQSPAQARGGSQLSDMLASGNFRWRMMLLRNDPMWKSRTGSGAFPVAWYDEELLVGALRGVARQGTRWLADYSDRRGYLPLRQQLLLKLNELGISAEPDNILVTNGATEAIHLVCQTLLAGPGIPVMLESPTQPLLGHRLLSTGMHIHPISRRHDGPDLEEMRAVCEKHKPRAFFCSSVLHNPTCSHIAPHKAYQILRLAEEFDMLIVEDDTYGDLMPRASAAPIARLATLDQLRRVIFVGSFSKTLGPGLRAGFLAANAERMEWLTTYRVVQGLSGSALSERSLYKALSGGAYRRHCEQLRNRLAEARPVVVAELARWGISVEAVPDAGMYLWASLGDTLDSVQVAERMLELGHLIAPAQAFLGGGSPPSPFVRINIAEAFESSMLPVLGKVLGRTRSAR